MQQSSSPMVIESAPVMDTLLEPEEGDLDNEEEDQWDPADEAAVQEEAKGVFVSRYSADCALFPILIGRGGSAKKQMEEASGAQIIFPPQQQSRNVVQVKGKSRAAVCKGCLRLRLAIDSALQSRLLDYNFFLSFPLANPLSVQKFIAFRHAVTSDTAFSASGLDPSSFMTPEHLHLTIAMLKLYSDEARYRAQMLLKKLQPQILELLAGPLQVHLQGLEIMNDDPSSIDVLYLQVHEVGPGNRLEQLCEKLVQEFASNGLLSPQDIRPVKLHATVINTRYAMRKAEAGAQRQQFDGRLLLQKLSSLDLGVVTLPAVHLSQRGSFDKETGYYSSLAVMQLN